SRVRPRGPLEPERWPPRRPEEMSCVELREAVCDSPERARSLFTVRAAISSARSVDAPRDLTDSLTASYWRARLVPFFTPRGGIALCQPFGFVLAQIALEQPPVALLVAQDGDDHVLGDGIDLVGLLDDAVVVLDGAGLGLDDALDDVHDVGLVLGRLQIGLLGGEVQRA